MQERQFPPSGSDQLAPAERAALRRVRVRRIQGLVGVAGAGLLTFFALGCPQPADLQNAQLYDKPGFITGGSASGGGATGEPCEVACVNDIFQKQQLLCVLCHNNKPPPNGLKSSMLDLESAGYTARLRNVPSVHSDLGVGMTKADCPTGDKLIDTAAPANSWLLKKIEGQQGNCGTPMPSTGMLTADQKKCLETYVSCVAGGAIGGGGMPSGGMPSGGSASGGAASGGGGSGGAATGGGGAASGGSAGASSGSGGTGGT